MAESLNLNQRRYIAAHQESPEFTGFQDKIRAIVGAPITVVVDWDSVGAALLSDSFNNMALNNGNNIRDYFLKNCEEGIALVCKDKFGCEAFAEKIKQVTLRHMNEARLEIVGNELIFGANLHGNGSPSKEMTSDFLSEKL